MAKSEQARKSPNFNTRAALDEIKSGLVKVVVTGGVIYLCISSLFRVDMGKIFNSWYVWVFPFLLLLLLFSMPLLTILFGMQSIIEGVLVFVNKNYWIKNAASTQATVVDKRMRSDYEYREDYSYEVIILEIKLKYSPVRAKTNPNEQTILIWAHVNIPIYEKYKIHDILDIYYSIADPFSFLIAGE